MSLDASFLARVRRAYRQALATDSRTRGMWGTIDARRADVHAALLADSDDSLREIFRDPVRTDLYYGVDNLCRGVLGNGPYDVKVAQSLGEEVTKAFAVLGDLVNRNGPESILDEFDALLRHKIEFPQPFRGELGLETSRGIVSYRAIQSLYQAWRVLDLLKTSNGKSVVEIGPGMGRTAFYLYGAGITDYSTIDLPLGVVAQACFLGAVLGPDKIWLPGDDDSCATGRINLLFARPSRNFDLTLNVDSLTEMRWDVALDYALWISQHTRLFLSINHRRNYFRVDEVATAGLTADKVCADPYPMRDGYLEETFFLTNAKSSDPWQRIATILLFLKAWGRRAMANLVRLCSHRLSPNS
jgi:hypothetical protein